MAVTVLTAGVRYEPAPLGLGGWATTPIDRGRTLGEATGPAGCALPQGTTSFLVPSPRRGVQTCMHGPRQQTGKASVLLCVCIRAVCVLPRPDKAGCPVEHCSSALRSHRSPCLILRAVTTDQHMMIRVTTK